MSDPIRVLVVDDSVIYRRIVCDVLQPMPGVQVVSVAVDGQEALEAIEAVRPDFITLDLVMPKIDGLAVLRELKHRGMELGVIVLSSHAEAGAKLTIDALELGAFDFVLKPRGLSPADNKAQLQRELLLKLEAYSISSRNKRIRAAPLPNQPAVIAPDRSSKHDNQPAEVVVIGASTGGPEALAQLLSSLDASFPAPVLVVQHMPSAFTRALSESLDRHCPLRVIEGEDGTIVLPGNVYIAPGGKQMKVTRKGTLKRLCVSDSPPEYICRPSADYLFRSVAEVYRGSAVGVVLTGMGSDGTEGCRLLKSLGARIIVQNEASCVVYGMPRSVVEAGLADMVSPLGDIAEQVKREVGVCCANEIPSVLSVSTLD